jgi:hypothetical protein
MHSSAGPSSASTTQQLCLSPYRRFAADARNSVGFERFRSLSDLVRKSDLIIVGSVTGSHWLVEPGIDPPYPLKTQALVYDLRATRIISGTRLSAPGRTAAVLLDLYERRFDVHPPLGHRTIFFLSRLGRTGHLYRPNSLFGIVDLDDCGLAFPLGAHAPWTEKFLDRGWDDAVTRLNSLASG